MKDTFILYNDYDEQIELLSMEQRGVLLTAIYAHQNARELPEMDLAVKIIFTTIRQRLDRDTEKYEDKLDKLREASARGVEARAEKRSRTVKQDNQTIPNGNQMVTDDNQMVPNGNQMVGVHDDVDVHAHVPVHVSPDGDVVNDLDHSNTAAAENPEREKRISEVSAYALGKGFKWFRAVRFVNYYTERGWPRNWKSKVDEWAEKDKPDPKVRTPATRFSNFEERSYDYDALEKQLNTAHKGRKDTPRPA